MTITPASPRARTVPKPAHGEIFTRPWVVDLILDLCGYTSDRELAGLRAIEPACGSGAFLGPMTARLSQSARAHGNTLDDLRDSVRAFDLQDKNVTLARDAVAKVLAGDGWDPEASADLASVWVREADYLLHDEHEDGATDLVVGNPPYIRIEELGQDLVGRYRAACPTMTGRADIYVGFIERGLRSLKADGVLGYIVADRWMRNSYGKPLREMITSGGYSVDATIVMHDVEAFEADVSAYPAISVIRRGKQGKPLVADTTSRFGAADAVKVATWAAKRAPKPLTTDSFAVSRLPHWFPGSDLWPTGNPVALRMIEHLNDTFGPIEDPATGTKVGIGIATGNDGVYITKNSDVVEPERLLPLSMAANTNSGSLTWSGNYLVNPWGEDGKPVALEDWPKFAAYMRKHEDTLLGRNIAKNRPATWWRTIDNVRPGLAERPKLLFPDMRMTSRPVLDPGGDPGDGGGLYPHHNLYWVSSEKWDLRVLGGLLFSRVAEATIDAYCVKMRGGTLRFQAQYLRRVRVPTPTSITKTDQAALAKAFDHRDPVAATKAAIRAYQLDGEMAEWLLATASPA